MICAHREYTDRDWTEIDIGRSGTRQEVESAQAKFRADGWVETALNIPIMLETSRGCLWIGGDQNTLLLKSYPPYWTCRDLGELGV